MKLLRLVFTVVPLLCANVSEIRAATGGTVLLARGAVTATGANQETRILAKGAAIFEGDVVNTSQKSFAVLRMVDNTKLTMKPQSTVAIGAFNDEEGKEEACINLVKGGLRTVTGLIGQRKPESFSVDTPIASIGIRGTDFIVRLCAGDECMNQEQNLRQSDEVGGDSEDQRGDVAESINEQIPEGLYGSCETGVIAMSQCAGQASGFEIGKCRTTQLTDCTEVSLSAGQAGYASLLVEQADDTSGEQKKKKDDDESSDDQDDDSSGEGGQGDEGSEGGDGNESSEGRGGSGVSSDDEGSESGQDTGTDETGTDETGTDETGTDEVSDGGSETGDNSSADTGDGGVEPGSSEDGDQNDPTSSADGGVDSDETSTADPSAVGGDDSTPSQSGDSAQGLGGDQSADTSGSSADTQISNGNQESQGSQSAPSGGDNSVAGSQPSLGGENTGGVANDPIGDGGQSAPDSNGNQGVSGGQDTNESGGVTPLTSVPLILSEDPHFALSDLTDAELDLVPNVITSSGQCSN